MKQPPLSNPIGARLRQLREVHGISGRDLAERIGHPQSYISKMETGRLYPSEVYFAAVADALNLTLVERESFRLLFEVYCVESASIHAESKQISALQELIEQFERSATNVRSFQNAIVPGLLQTPRYMEAVLGTFFDVAQRDQMQAAVEARKQRQLVLGDSKKHFCFLLMESAVRSRFAAPPIMRQQIRHLRTVSRQKHVSLGVIPSSMQLTVVAATSFDLFDETIAVSDSIPGIVTHSAPRDITEYQSTFEKLSKLAVWDDKARQWLRMIETSFA